MPVDPTIALSVRPFDPLAGVERAVQLRGMLQQQKIAEQQRKDQAAITTAMATLDLSKPESLNGLPSAVLKAGGSGNAAIAAHQRVLQMRQAAASLGEAETKAAQQRNDQLTGALTAFDDVPDEKLAEAVTGLAPELVKRGLLDPQHAQAITEAAGKMDAATLRGRIDFLRKTLTAQSTILKEREVKATELRAANTGSPEMRTYNALLAQPGPASAPAPTIDLLNPPQPGAAPAVQAAAGKAISPLEALQRVKSAARPPQENLDLVARVLGPADSSGRWAAGIRFLNANGMSNEALANLGITSEYSADAVKAAKALAKPPSESQGLDMQAARAWLAKPGNAGKTMDDALKHIKSITPAINNYFGLYPTGRGAIAPTGADGQPLTGPDLLKTFGANAGTVKAVAEGRQDPPTATALKSPHWIQIMQQVQLYDPDWSPQRAQIRKAFATGPDGRNIGALNTATAHLDQLAEAAKAMDNGSWQPGNRLYNYFATKFGSDKVTNYKYVMNALAGETASALKGNATDPEIAHVMETLSPDMSPEQARGVAESGLHVMGAKLNTYNERYHQQIPGDTVWSPVFPTAARVFQKYGIDWGGTGEVSPAAGAGTAAGVKTSGGHTAGVKTGGAARHVIQIGKKKYVYNGSGDTADLKNYTEQK